MAAIVTVSKKLNSDLARTRRASYLYWLGPYLLKKKMKVLIVKLLPNTAGCLPTARVQGPRCSERNYRRLRTTKSQFQIKFCLVYFVKRIQ